MNQKNLFSLGIVALLLLATSCATFFGTVVTITQVRDSAMKQLASLNKQGLINAETDAKIAEADVQYRAAAHAAELALIAYKNGGSPDNYYNALEVVRASVDTILAILRPLVAPETMAPLETNLKNAHTL